MLVSELPTYAQPQKRRSTLKKTHYKRPPRPVKKRKAGDHSDAPPAPRHHRKTAIADLDEDDVSLSDGQSALREVEAREQAMNARTGTRGPSNLTLQHWHPAQATTDQQGRKRWIFRCKFCGWYALCFRYILAV